MTALLTNCLHSPLQALRTLMDAQTKEKFHILMNAFYHWCKEEETDANGLIRFKKYFTEHYAQRTEAWAACYRQGAGINTNMRLEALHRVIKYCYLDGKHNKRVDRLISVLLKLTRDKIFDRLIKNSKNARTSFQKAAAAKHRMAEKISADDVESTGIQEWTVVSQTTPGIQYVVIQKGNGLCEETCPLSCAVCKVCAHNVTCSCIDNTLRRNLCKHIHAVTASKELDSASDHNTAQPSFQVCLLHSSQKYFSDRRPN